MHTLTAKGENTIAEDVMLLNHAADRHFRQWTTLLRAEEPAQTRMCDLGVFTQKEDVGMEAGKVPDVSIGA